MIIPNIEAELVSYEVCRNAANLGQLACIVGENEGVKWNEAMPTLNITSTTFAKLQCEVIIRREYPFENAIRCVPTRDLMGSMFKGLRRALPAVGRGL
jgi:hypothetical protein